MCLYDKNILKYGQIARNGTESMILDTEGRSRPYNTCHYDYLPRPVMNVLSSSAPSGYKIIINNLNVLYDLNQNQNGS